MKPVLGFGWQVALGAFCICSATAAPSIPPRVIDNSDADFSQQGFEIIGTTNSFGGTVAVNPATGKDLNYARYKPELAGRYDVYLYWGDFPDKDRDVTWAVKHAKGSTTQPFNQRQNPGWHFHGTYLLNPSSHVELSVPRITEGGRRRNGPVVADAVKFVPTTNRVVVRVAKDTITPVTLNYEDELNFTLRDGEVRVIKLVRTGAEKGRPYKFWADLTIDGQAYRIERTNPSQESFYEPLAVKDVRVWLDAVSDIFTDDGGWMVEKDIRGAIACRPKRKARLVVNDVHDRICPEPITWWYPEKKDHLDVHECYNGEDVWMGPYFGNQAHGGLDINMKSGTFLYAPIGFDNQYLFNALTMGDNNNRWRGIRKWPNGSTWWLQAHHLNKMLTPEHVPLALGAKYAETAGTYIGSHPHTRFVFRIFEEGESYFVDPWILFWQTFKDQTQTETTR